MTCTDKAAEIKPGDVFEIQVTVFGFLVDTAMIDLGDGRRVSIDTASLLAGRRVARPLGIGERVRSREWGAAVLEIVAVYKLWAWVKDCQDSMVQVPLSDLERAPAPDTKEGT